VAVANVVQADWWRTRAETASLPGALAQSQWACIVRAAGAVEREQPQSRVAGRRWHMRRRQYVRLGATDVTSNGTYSAFPGNFTYWYKVWGDVLCRGSGGQKSSSGVQGRSPGMGSGGRSYPEAEAILDFYMHNFDLILNYVCFARATSGWLMLRNGSCLSMK